MAVARVEEAIVKSEEEAVKKLTEAVAIESVSALPEKRTCVRRMAEWIKGQIEHSYKEAVVSLEEIPGEETFADGSKQPYPPLVFVDLQVYDPKKKTVLIYAHYDVQPATPDGWETSPFVLTAVGEKQLRGRGATDDKGPLVGWLHVFAKFAETGTPLPVNVQMVLEGMEECGSVGFNPRVECHAKQNPAWWSRVDYCVVSDNYWLTTHKPCLTYGLRGVTTFRVTVEGPEKDLHSGVFSGPVFQPLDDLWYLLSKLKAPVEDVESSGCSEAYAEGVRSGRVPAVGERILIPGIYDEVAPVTEDERARYAKLTFDVADFRKELGVSELRTGEDAVALLMSRWRYPTLSLHGIEGAYSGSGCKTVIPSRVIGKFSIRSVPLMQNESICRATQQYLSELMATRHSANKMSVRCESGVWFFVSPDSAVFRAAHKAVREVWGVDPDYTREGGSIPVTLTLGHLTGSDVCLLPMGRCDDGAHSQNEKIDRDTFLQGMKVFAHFLHNLAAAD